MGLAFCKKIVLSMEGNIYVKSKPKTGTKIYLEFPKQLSAQLLVCLHHDRQIDWRSRKHHLQITIR